MPLQLHPAARQNFDTRAASLVSLICELPAREEPGPRFQSDIPAATVISDEDLVGEPSITTTDYRGKVVSREFRHEGKGFGIPADSYGDLAQLAEKIQSVPTIRTVLSLRFIEEAIFEWVRLQYCKTGVTRPFVDHLEQRAAAAIKRSTSWTPVAFLEVESPFPVASSEVRPISKQVFDEWQEYVRGLCTEADRPEVEQMFSHLRRKVQGLAAVVTTVEAEPDRALEWAREEAERVAAALSLFSAGAHLPDVKCVCAPKGSETIRTSFTIIKNEQPGFATHESTIDASSASYWRLDSAQIEHIRAAMLDRVSELMRETSHSAFSRTVLNSILLYSKSTFTSEPVEKLVYILAGLESVLLKNESEPIQQNLAERLAFLLARNLADRKSILANVRSVYGIRSRYLHHGHSLQDMKVMTDFMAIVAAFYVRLTANVSRFETKDAFVTALDDLKLAG